MGSAELSGISHCRSTAYAGAAGCTGLAGVELVMAGAEGATLPQPNRARGTHAVSKTQNQRTCRPAETGRYNGAAGDRVGSGLEIVLRRDTSHPIPDPEVMLQKDCNHRFRVVGSAGSVVAQRRCGLTQMGHSHCYFWALVTYGVKVCSFETEQRQPALSIRSWLGRMVGQHGQHHGRVRAEQRAGRPEEPVAV